MIPEGQKQSGWQGFLKELQLLLDPTQKDKPPGSKMVEYVNTQGNRGEKSYAATVIEGGVRQPAKPVEKHAQREERDNAEQAVVLTAATSDEKGKQSTGERSDKIPQIVPPIKRRSPLRFFPNVASRRDYRDGGQGFTITLKENGQRVVSRNKSAQDSSNNKDVMRMGIRQDKKLGGGPNNNNQNFKWVPRQVETRPLQTNGLFTEISPIKETANKSGLKYPMGSRNRPTFEVGETSAKGSIGLEDSPNSYSPAQPLSETKMRPPTALDSSSDTVTETSITCEKLPGSFNFSNRQLLGRKWVYTTMGWGSVGDCGSRNFSMGFCSKQSRRRTWEMDVGDTRAPVHFLDGEFVSDGSGRLL